MNIICGHFDSVFDTVTYQKATWLVPIYISRGHPSRPPHTVHMDNTIWVYMIFGALPIEAEIHVRQLGLLGAILRSNTPLREIALRQVAVKEVTSPSWFVHVATLLIKYELPALVDLFRQPPAKGVWKESVKKQVHFHWTTKLREEAEEKTTLQYLNISTLSTQDPHLVVASVRSYPKDVTRASVKVKLLTGNYMLAAVEAHHSRWTTKPTCPLCGADSEDITHFLLDCSSTAEVRSGYIEEVKALVCDSVGVDTWSLLEASPARRVQLLLDPTVLVV
jgi:hypothetical protein